MYYLKSEKGFWLPNAFGYTCDKKEAGIFSLEQMKNLNLDGVTLIAANI